MYAVSDPLCRELRAALAAYEGIPAEQIVCGNGAADLIFRIVAATHPRRALLLEPTFAEYEQALRAMDCSIAYFPLQESEGFVLPEAFLQQLTPEINLLFLCNPNNPTGRTVPPALLREIWKRCEEAGILLVVDECFNEFLEHPEQNTLKGVLKTGTNSVILKAFTKSFAMPGLRLGYGLCGNGDLAERIFSCGQPWACPSRHKRRGRRVAGEGIFGAHAAPGSNGAALAFGKPCPVGIVRFPVGGKLYPVPHGDRDPSAGADGTARRAHPRLRQLPRAGQPLLPHCCARARRK
ncbi:MAG: aminotransferase class I/II-fold pyridoxal phosphate-dependent enzyme [Anaeromassilibacillus sp.]